MLGVGDVRDDLEVRAALRVEDLVLERFDVALERRRLVAQIPDRVEDEAGLVLGRRRGEDLSAGLVVRARHVDRNAAAQRRLPVLTRDVHVQLGDDPDVAVGVVVPVHPAEDGRDHVRDLPRVRLERLPRPLALGVPQLGEGLDDLVDARRVEQGARLVARLGSLVQRRAVRQREPARGQEPADLRRELQPVQRLLVRHLHRVGARRGLRLAGPACATRRGCRPRHRRPLSRGPAHCWVSGRTVRRTPAARGRRTGRSPRPGAARCASSRCPRR